MKNTLLVVLLLFFGNLGFSQGKPAEWYLVEGLEPDKLIPSDKQLIDSLLTIFHASNIDTVQIECLNQIVENSADNNIWSKYNGLILKMSENRSEKVYIKYYSAALNNMGFLADIKGNTSLAINYYTTSLKLREKHGDLRGIAESLHNIGTMYMDRKNFENSLSYFFKAVEVEKKIKDNFLLTGSLNRIGDIFSQQKKFKEALQYLNQAVGLAEQSKDKRLIASTYTRLGDVNSAILNERRAIDCYNIAIKNAIDVNDKSRLSLAYKSTSKFYFSRDNNTEAEKYALLVYNIGRELASPKVIMSGSELLYSIYKKEGDVYVVKPI